MATGSEPHPLDAEIQAFIAASEADYPADAASRPVAEQRRFYDAMCARFRGPRPTGLTIGDESVAGPAGPIPLRRYTPNGGGAPGLRVVYFHGGGFFLGGLESHDDVCAELAARGGVELVSIDYRLAPEHPFPAAHADAAAAVAALVQDGRRLILMGDSVGGGLAAGLSLTAPSVGAVLIYPSLAAGRQTAPSYAEHAHAPLFTRADALKAVGLHAGDADPAALAADPRFAPLSADDVAAAPTTHVIVAEVDPVRDDGLMWVKRLDAAGVRAAAHVHAGLPHGCLRARHMSLKASAFFDAVVSALRSVIHDARKI
ncbi:MAG: alpha/beta hydrolase [Pseudomonadota bacterium]